MLQILFERYQLDRVLSQSAEAQTYQAMDTKTGQFVVVKRLGLGKINAWKRLELFEREAKTLASLNHPRIPRLLDFYREENSDGLTATLVTAWIEGESLAAKIDSHWHPDEQTTLRLAEQLLWILNYLHAFQPPVVHRDIKPSNIILGSDGNLYLIDFGGAQKRLHATGGGGSTVIGTFGYMAPEQFAGRAVPASDLYGIGTSLVHLVSGYAPVNLPQRNLELVFQGLVPGSGGFIRWLTKMCRSSLEARFINAYNALEHLYLMTGLTPGQAIEFAPAPQLSDSIQSLLMESHGPTATPASATQALDSGTQVDNYQITRVLAQGSHTTSYLARTLDTQADVFLKAIHLQAQRTWKGLTLFEREIAALKDLSHPRIPQFIRSFKTEANDYFLVTQKLDGLNLEQKLQTGWRPLESEIIEIATQALDILIYLHAQKPAVVHRDIKPSNFIIHPAGKLFLTDFGGIQNHIRTRSSGGSTIIGTYGYIAPEEFLKNSVPASDLYSLGVTLVRLLSGYEPTSIPQQGLRLDFRNLLNCSESLKDWLEKLTEPDLKQRTQTASQAKSELIALQMAIFDPATLPVTAPLKRVSNQSHQFALSEIEREFIPIQLDTQAHAAQNFKELQAQCKQMLKNALFQKTWRTKILDNLMEFSPPSLQYTRQEAFRLAAYCKAMQIEILNPDFKFDLIKHLQRVRPFLSFTLQLIFRRYKAVIIIAVLLAIFTNPILSLFLVSLAALDALLNHPPAPFVRYPKNWHHQLTLQLYTQKSRNALVSYSIAHRQESLWALLFFRKKPIQQIKRIILYIFRRELHFKIQRLVFCPENSRSIYLVRIFYQESGNKHQEAIPFNSLEEAQVMVQILISANRLYRLQASKSSESNFQIDTQ